MCKRVVELCDVGLWVGTRVEERHFVGQVVDEKEAAPVEAGVVGPGPELSPPARGGVWGCEQAVHPAIGGAKEELVPACPAGGAPHGVGVDAVADTQAVGELDLEEGGRVEEGKHSVDDLGRDADQGRDAIDVVGENADTDVDQGREVEVVCGGQELHDVLWLA